MYRTWLASLAMLFTLTAAAQKEIKIDELDKHIGDSVTVCTKIYGGVFLDRSKGTPTLLNAGGTYPGSPLTVYIGTEARAQFKEAPEIFFKEKEVCITGKLILYKEKPEIIIYDEKQLVIKKD